MGALSCIASLVMVAVMQSAEVYRETEPLDSKNWCFLLENLNAGDVQEVFIEGIILAGEENRAFFDPYQPYCSMSVQPSSWVEYEASLELPDEFKRLMRENGFVHVRINADLWGPAVFPPDDTSLPLDIAYAKRVAGSQRFGHLGGFRTKVVVKKIVEFSRVADDMLVLPAYQDPLPLSSDPASLDFPQYPQRARFLQISGEVIITVRIENGRVVQSRVSYGDRILAAAAAANVKTWVFADSKNESFSVVFRYILEQRPLGSPSGTRVEFQLPYEVRITAKQNDW
jgi:hypothetical protein